MMDSDEILLFQKMLNNFKCAMDNIVAGTLRYNKISLLNNNVSEKELKTYLETQEGLKVLLTELNPIVKESSPIDIKSYRVLKIVNRFKDLDTLVS